MNRRMISMITIGVVFLAGFLSFSMNGEGQAEAPEWDEGDEWSMGYETDLGEMITSMLGELEGLEEEEFGSIDHDVEGKAAYYMIFRVAEETGTQYTMDISTGGGVDIDGNAKITMDMPEEGEYRYGYDSWDFEPPMETKEITIDLVLGVSVKVEGTAHFTQDGLKLQDLKMVMTLEGNFDLDIVNFPEMDNDFDPETDEMVMTVEYTDYDMSGSADIKATFDMDFDPPLDIFDFPIRENEEWTAESNVTVSGTYEGTLDADGIPEEMMMEMLEENIVLPIILEDLDTGIDEVKDGVIAEFESPVSLPISCTGTETVILADGSSSEAHVIQFGEEDDHDDGYYYGYYEEEDSYGSDLSGMKLLYCPEEGFFVSAQMEGMGADLGMYDMSGSMDTFELKPMKTSDAEKNIGAFQGEVSGDDEGLGILLWGLIAAVIIVVLFIILMAVITVVLMMKKRSSDG
ncbi:MAG: hypothetical protein R6V01_01345 [Thermoplasmatota archaeon]